MQADVFVLGHDPTGLQRIPDIEILGQIACRSAKPRAQLDLLAILGKGDAVDRTDVDAGVAFDAERTAEHGLDIAIEAALGFEIAELLVEPELALDLDVL